MDVNVANLLRECPPCDNDDISVEQCETKRYFDGTVDVTVIVDCAHREVCKLRSAEEEGASSVQLG